MMEYNNIHANEDKDELFVVFALFSCLLNVVFIVSTFVQSRIFTGSMAIIGVATFSIFLLVLSRWRTYQWGFSKLEIEPEQITIVYGKKKRVIAFSEVKKVRLMTLTVPKYYGMGESFILVQKGENEKYYRSGSDYCQIRSDENTIPVWFTKERYRKIMTFWYAAHGKDYEKEFSDNGPTEQKQKEDPAIRISETGKPVHPGPSGLDIVAKEYNNIHADEDKNRLFFPAAILSGLINIGFTISAFLNIEIFTLLWTILAAAFLGDCLIKLLSLKTYQWIFSTVEMNSTYIRQTYGKKKRVIDFAKVKEVRLLTMTVPKKQERESPFILVQAGEDRIHYQSGTDYGQIYSDENTIAVWYTEERYRKIMTFWYAAHGKEYVESADKPDKV